MGESLTIGRLKKKLAERRIVLSMRFAVQKNAFVVKAIQWNKDAATCTHADLEVAITTVLDQIEAFKPMTAAEKAQSRADARRKAYEDECAARLREEEEDPL